MERAPQDQITELLDVPRDFLKEGTQFINRMWPLCLEQMYTSTDMLSQVAQSVRSIPASPTTSHLPLRLAPYIATRHPYISHRTY